MLCWLCTMARAVGAYIISPTRLRKANFRAKIVNIHNIKIFTIFALSLLCTGVSGKWRMFPQPGPSCATNHNSTTHNGGQHRRGYSLPSPIIISLDSRGIETKHLNVTQPCQPVNSVTSKTWNGEKCFLDTRTRHRKVLRSPWWQMTPRDRDSCCVIYSPVYRLQSAVSNKDGIFSRLVTK